MTEKILVRIIRAIRYGSVAHTNTRQHTNNKYYIIIVCTYKIILYTAVYCTRARNVIIARTNIVYINRKKNIKHNVQ